MDNTDTKCTIRRKSKETTQHVLECEKGNKFTLRTGIDNRGLQKKIKRREKMQ